MTSKFTRNQGLILVALVAIACVIFTGLGLAAFALFGGGQQAALLPAGPTETPNPPTTTPTDAPEPTATPPPFGSIPTDRQEFVDHFEYEYGFIDWTQSAGDGTVHITGISPSERQKINIWSTQADPENITELFFSFRFGNDDQGIEDKERRTGVEGMLDTMQIALPAWEEGGKWIEDSLVSDEAKTTVDGVSVYLEQDYEDGSGDYIVIFTVIEE